ncbi:MAG: M20/M25/M40 family metallo-hydrolase [Nitriliruptorales bacterium]|nr:M20/M25/M40 family metallo-hydrolase [Nitriliruptorales bacterium]
MTEVLDAEPLRGLRARTSLMLEAVEALVNIESPSSEVAATAGCAQRAASLGERLLGAEPGRILVDGRLHLCWRFGRPRVLLLGHLDTVWPLGTLARWPFAVRDGVATGPGVFDMKAGVVQGMFALSTLGSLEGVALLLTTDEELGSPSSRELIERTALGLEAALVLEPSVRGALKTGRKGVSLYRLAVEGRAAHAGLDPERGVNALVELAHQILAIQGTARPTLGTTVTPSVAAGGTATNVVPATAEVAVDVRTATVEEQQRVDEELARLQPVLPEVRLRLDGGANRPPLPETAAAELFERASAAASRLGLPALRAESVGGGSDGNFTAGIGVPTLDGLGAVGDGAHAEGEHVLVDALPERAALVAALLIDLLARPVSS